MRRVARERGQAAVEMLAALPVLLLLGLAVSQLLAVGYAAVLAGNAAEAGALALAARADPEASARKALPGWGRARRERGGERAVASRSAYARPSLVPALERELEITSTASVAR